MSEAKTTDKQLHRLTDLVGDLPAMLAADKNEFLTPELKEEASSILYDGELALFYCTIPRTLQQLAYLKRATNSARIIAARHELLLRKKEKSKAMIDVTEKMIEATAELKLEAFRVMSAISVKIYSVNDGEQECQDLS